MDFFLQWTSIGEWSRRIWNDGSGVSHEFEEEDEEGKLDQTWSVRRSGKYKSAGGSMRTPHTDLEGVVPFMYWGYGL